MLLPDRTDEIIQDQVGFFIKYIHSNLDIWVFFFSESFIDFDHHINLLTINLPKEANYYGQVQYCQSNR